MFYSMTVLLQVSIKLLSECIQPYTSEASAHISAQYAAGPQFLASCELCTAWLPQCSP